MKIQIFGLTIQPEVPVLLIADGLILLSSVYYGVALRYAIGDPAEYGDVLPLFPRAAAYTLIMLAIFAAMGMYGRDINHRNVWYYARIVLSIAIGAALMFVAGHVVQRLFLGRASIAATAGLTCVLIAGARFIMYRYVIDRGVYNRKG